MSDAVMDVTGPDPARREERLASFEDFYMREFESIVGLAYVLCGNWSTAEDIAQDGFVIAHRRRSAPRGPSWLYCRDTGGKLNQGEDCRTAGPMPSEMYVM